MKKYLLGLSFLIGLSIHASAQLTMTLQVPPSGVLLKPQLWNAVVINSYVDTKQIFLGLTLTNATTGEQMLTATTSQISIETGALQLQESNLSPITYTYLSGSVYDRDPDGFLPAGSYTACYTLFVIDENAGTPVTEECIPVNVEPVSPPLLNTPFDKQVLETTSPQFTWIPPTPPEIFSNLNYDFVLVEVQDGQNPNDAIQQNLPIYTTNQPDEYLNYPSAGISLDTGKIYAWQVTARNNNNYTGKSDVWTFDIAGNSPDSAVPVEPSPFIRLKKELGAAISVVSDTLHVHYNNEAVDSAVAYQISGIDEDNSRMIVSDSLVLNPGDNMLSFPLRDNREFISQRSYLFKLINSRNEIWSVKFIFQRQDQ